MERLSHWLKEVRAYWRDSGRFSDFVRLMRVRLSQSKVGPWVAPHPIVVSINLKSLGDGIRLRSHTTDISVLAEIVMGGSIGSLPEGADPTTVVDLGANIGLAYRWLRRRYPTAEFVCVEPDPGNLEILRANVESAQGPCRVIGACIGGRERYVSLASADGEWGYRMVEPSFGADASVPVITMKSLLDETGLDRVDVLKCDIEGAEGELFEDCSAWIGDVQAMVVECHLDSTSTESLAHTLATNGADLMITHVDRNPRMGFEIATFERRVNGAS